MPFTWQYYAEPIAMELVGGLWVLETLLQLEYLDLRGNSHLLLDDFLPIARMSRLKEVVLMGGTGLPEHMRHHYLNPDMIAELQSELATLG